MKRINNDPNEKLVFEPKSGLMYEAAMCINHGLELPKDKFLWSMGIYTDGFLETKNGRKIEVARRKLGSYQIHLAATPEYTETKKEPILLFPDSEINEEVTVPENFFLPYFNCHGFTFADSEYWINPMCFERDLNGNISSKAENIRILLEDEYYQVTSEKKWDVAILLNFNNEIVHSVKRENHIIFSKYDGYQLEKYNRIEDVEIQRYGNGNFKFFKNLT